MLGDTSFTIGSAPMMIQVDDNNILVCGGGQADLKYIYTLIFPLLYYISVLLILISVSRLSRSISQQGLTQDSPKVYPKLGEGSLR